MHLNLSSRKHCVDNMKYDTYLMTQLLHFLHANINNAKIQWKSFRGVHGKNGTGKSGTGKNAHMGIF